MDILVVKKGKSENQLTTKVKRRMNRGFSNADYQKVLDVKNYKDIATFLSDLEILYQAPIEKAYKQYRSKRSPFW